MGLTQHKESRDPFAGVPVLRWDQLPRIKGVYRWTTPDGVSYVGCSTNLRKRALAMRSDCMTRTNPSHLAYRKYRDEVKYQILYRGRQYREMELGFIEQDREWNPKNCNVYEW